MGRFVCFVAGLLVVIASDLPAQPTADKGKDKSTDDTVAANIEKAKAAYRKATADAAEKLDKGIGAEIKKVANAPNILPQVQLKLLGELGDQHKAFQADPSKVPDHPRLADERKNFLAATKKAKEGLEQAFEREMKALIGQKNVPGAMRLQQELADYLTPLVRHAGFYRININTKLIQLTNKGDFLADNVKEGTWKGDGDKCEITYPDGLSTKCSVETIYL